MGSVLTSPPPSNYSAHPVHTLHKVPSQQPMPRYETQSAFDDTTMVNNDNLNVMTTSYPAHLAHSSRGSDSGNGHLGLDPRMASDPVYRRLVSTVHAAPTQGQPKPGSGLPLEQAVENVQSHPTALSEHPETLKISQSSVRIRPATSPRDLNSPNRFGAPSVRNLKENKARMNAANQEQDQPQKQDVTEATNKPQTKHKHTNDFSIKQGNTNTILSPQLKRLSTNRSQSTRLPLRISTRRPSSSPSRDRRSRSLFSSSPRTSVGKIGRKLTSQQRSSK